MYKSSQKGKGPGERALRGDTGLRVPLSESAPTEARGQVVFRDAARPQILGVVSLRVYYAALSKNNNKRSKDENKNKNVLYMRIAAECL